MVAVVAAGVTSAPAASAGEEDAAVTWSVRPASPDGADGRAWIELAASPGEHVTEHMAVRNLSDHPATFRLQAADGLFTDEGRFTILSGGEVSSGAGTWISLPDEVTVDPGGTEVVPIRIALPAEAEPGDHAAGVAASVLRTAAQGPADLAVESRVGFRVMVRVAGAIIPRLEAEVTAVGYDGTWNPFAPGRARVAVELRNRGNARLAVPGTIAVGGRSIALEAVELLPDDVRTVAGTVSGVWPLVAVGGSVALDPELVADADADIASMTADFTVWAVPWPQLLVLAASALIALGLLVGRRRSRARVEDRVAEARRRGAAEAIAAVSRTPGDIRGSMDRPAVQHKEEIRS